MTPEQEKEISNYKGDPTEEKWKPGIAVDYLDLYHYWKLREINAAGGIEGYTSKTADGRISQNFLFALERIPQYYHSVYCRLGALKTAKLELDKLCQRVLSGSPETDALYDKIETFYFFSGSILDNIAGLSNIILQNKKGREDSYADFMKHTDLAKFKEEGETDILKESLIIKDNYRDHFSHRPRLGLILKNNDGANEIHLQDQFIKSGPAERLITWRKEFREIIEERKSTSDVRALTKKHFKAIERTVEILLKYSFQNYDAFLDAEGVKKGVVKIDTKNIPANTKFIFYACRTERDPYLRYWYHSVDNAIPDKCSLETCKSEIIEPVYFVSA